MKTMKMLQGTGVALITPFKADKSVDVQALEQLVHYQIDNGIDYLVVLGTTAETPTLSAEEKESRTGSNIDYHTTLRLAKEVPNIIGIKEASGNIVQIMHLLLGRPEGFLVISGDDATALPTVLLGGDGTISVLGQAFPKRYSQMIRQGLEENYKEANTIQYQLLEAMELIFKEGNPVGIKALLSLLGIGSPEVRLPLCTASDSLQQQLKAFLQK